MKNRFLGPILGSALTIAPGCVIEERGPNQDTTDTGHNLWDSNHGNTNTPNRPGSPINPEENLISDQQVIEITNQIRNRFDTLSNNGQIDQQEIFRGVFNDMLPESAFQVTPVIYTSNLMGQFGRNRADQIYSGVNSYYLRNGNNLSFTDIAVIEADERLKLVP